MTPERIAELRALLANATPLPWRFLSGHDAKGDSVDLLMAEVGKAGEGEEPEYAEVFFAAEFGDAQTSANWELAKEAVNAVPELLTALEAAQAEREAGLMAHMERLRAALKSIQGEACPIGSDFGNSKILKLAEDALLATPEAALEEFGRKLVLDCLDSFHHIMINPEQARRVTENPGPFARILADLSALRAEAGRVALTKAADAAFVHIECTTANCSKRILTESELRKMADLDKIQRRADEIEVER